MEEDALSRIIKTEKEIRERLEDEKSRAAELIKKVKRETGDKVIDEETRLKETAEDAILEARSAVEADALEIAGKAAKEAERLGEIKGDELKGIIRRHIAMILPGRNS